LIDEARTAAAGVDRRRQLTREASEHKESPMKNRALKGVAIAGALATLMAPAVAFAGKSKATKGVHCEGTNDCKGKGNCKSASHDCKGKNDCKGQGFTVAKNAKACEAKGGKVESAKKAM
jgi:hypothetical protein